MFYILEQLIGVLIEGFKLHGVLLLVVGVNKDSLQNTNKCTKLQQQKNTKIQACKSLFRLNSCLSFLLNSAAHQASVIIGIDWFLRSAAWFPCDQNVACNIAFRQNYIFQLSIPLHGKLTNFNC